MSTATVVLKASDDPTLSQQPLDTVEELNENVPSEIFEIPVEERTFVEIPARIFGLKEVFEPLTIPSLNNAIYELGVVNMCWPEINEPVFETRTCFPVKYYTNSPKERLLLAYAESFRRQYNLHYKMRKPLLLQVPNECGLQKMVCTSIRPTKLCFADTNTWQGVANLVSDYFDYEPLTKPILQKIIKWYGSVNVVHTGQVSTDNDRLIKATPIVMTSRSDCITVHSCLDSVGLAIELGWHLPPGALACPGPPPGCKPA